MSFGFISKRKACCPTLRELCTRVLVNNKHTLGDLGQFPISLFIPVLAHCTPEELKTVEDLTLESSGRDIRLHTWQIWKRIYQTKFGKPNTIDVPELPLHDIDEDLILGSPAETPGDYRLLYERKLKQADSDRKQLVERLKKLRRKEAISKEQKKAKRIDAVDLRKIKRSTKRVQYINTYKKKSQSSVAAETFYNSIGLKSGRKPFSRR